MGHVEVTLSNQTCKLNGNTLDILCDMEFTKGLNVEDGVSNPTPLLIQYALF